MKLHSSSLGLVAGAWSALTLVAQAQTALFDRHGDGAGDQFGWALAFVGDVDADGVEDFAAGAPFDDVAASNAGMVRVYSGRTLGVLYTWRGNAANDRFGYSLAGAGDLDGDGHDDVLIGAPQSLFSNPGGYAVVRSGANGTALRTVLGTPGQALGHSVAGGGFVDADGTPDLLIGAPYDDAGWTSRGRVLVVSGASGTTLRSHAGTVDYGTFGWSVEFLGDVDGDGRDDYAGGGPAAWNNWTHSYVRAFDGAFGIPLWDGGPTNLSDSLGWSLASIGDLNGDGVRDVLAGAMEDAGVGCGPCDGKGYVRALDGATGATLYQVNGTNFYAGLGWDVVAIGDVNGNGYEDFAASQPSTEGCGGNTMPVLVREGLDGSAILDLPAVGGAGSVFGHALASGDANGDGLRDLLVGAPCESPNGNASGAIHAYTVVRSVALYCQAESNSLGCTPAMFGSGTPSASLAAVFSVGAANVLNNKSGLLFYGFKPRQTPFQGGHMCIVAPTQRTPPQNSGGAAPPASDCSGAFSLDFNARIQSGVDPLLVAGEEVFAQYWSRDPADASTTNLSGALAFFIAP